MGLYPELTTTSAQQLRIKDHFCFRTFWTKFWNILKHGMNLKLETLVRILRKIIQLNAVIILKSTNEYYRKIISKSGRKMNLYPAMDRSPFCIFHILNEILQNPELIDTFLVGKPFLYFLGRLSNEMKSTFYKTLTNTIQKIFKNVATKWTFILLWRYLIAWYRLDKISLT